MGNISKARKNLVYHHISELRDKLENKSLVEKFNAIKKFEMPKKYGSIVLCANCITLRNTEMNDICCDRAPDYDMGTTYTKILEEIS